MQTTSESRVGVVLAGGYSTRFGDREKALAELHGRPLLFHAVNGVAPAVDGVLVNCRQDQRPAFRSALASASTDAAFVCDPEPDRGPAAGLATALEAVGAPRVAVVACDMPYIDATFLEWLFQRLDEENGVVPCLDGVPQPTHAVFATDPARQAARGVVTEDDGSLRGVLRRLDIAEVPESRVLARTPESSFTDVNTPGQLESIDEDGAESDDGMS